MSSQSSISALIQVVDNWAQALDQGYEICVIFFDIQKAFDTVPHLLLLEKLRALEVNPYLLRWIESYLANRTQYVGVDGYDSCNIWCTSRVNSCSPTFHHAHTLMMFSTSKVTATQDAHRGLVLQVTLARTLWSSVLYVGKIFVSRL